MVRTLAIGFEKSADWERVAGLHHGVQEDLDLPAPAISVPGRGGYRVWFSLAEAVPAAQARAFLEMLRRRYLADLPAKNLRFHPDPGGAGQEELGPADLLPTRHGAAGKWSAFIDPAMGAMFMDEAGLEMEPNPDRQADLLAGFKPIGAADFRRVLEESGPGAEPADNGPEPAPASQAAGPSRPRLDVGGGFTDPRSFLLAVMNDPTASPELRIEAAKALLPYSGQGDPR